MRHDLKIYPEFFSAVCTGVKRAELRKNDRNFQAGDVLHLMETVKGSFHATGEFINVTVTHVADVGEWMPGYVMLSIDREPAPVSVHKGWRLVPVEPTREMRMQIHPISVGRCMECDREVTADCEDNVLLSWSDMLAAAPTP